MGHTIILYDALRDLAPFVQFEKREKHPPWMSVYVYSVR